MSETSDEMQVQTLPGRVRDRLNADRVVENSQSPTADSDMTGLNHWQNVIAEWETSLDCDFGDLETEKVGTTTVSSTRSGKTNPANVIHLNKDFEQHDIRKKTTKLYEQNKMLNKFKRFYRHALQGIAKQKIRAFYLKVWVDCPQLYPGCEQPEVYIQPEFIIDIRESDDESIREILKDRASDYQRWTADVMVKRAALRIKSLCEKQKEALSELETTFDYAPAILAFTKNRLTEDLQKIRQEVGQPLCKFEEWLAGLPTRQYQAVLDEKAKKECAVGSRKQKVSHRSNGKKQLRRRR